MGKKKFSWYEPGEYEVKMKVRVKKGEPRTDEEPELLELLEEEE